MGKTCGLIFLDPCLDEVVGKPQGIPRRDGRRFVLKSVAKGDVNHGHVLAHNPSNLSFMLLLPYTNKSTRSPAKRTDSAPDFMRQEQRQNLLSRCTVVAQN